MSELIQRYTPQLADERRRDLHASSRTARRCRAGRGRGGSNSTRRTASQPILRTGRETTQPDRRALEYWASGLEPLYFEGAFERARGG